MNNSNPWSLDLGFSEPTVLQELDILQTLMETVALRSQYLLQSFALRDGFASRLSFAFGDEAETTTLKTDWLTGNFDILSRVSIRSAQALNGADGAYAAATDTIYLSRDFLLANRNDPERIVSVLLEEVGHRIDARLNPVDSTGDEGYIFSALVQQGEITPGDLQAARTENDQTMLNLNGRVIPVEQSTEQDFSFRLVSRPTGTTYFVTNTNNDGNGSLRDAIRQANANSDFNIIDLSEVSGTIGLEDSIIIRNPLEIRGDGNDTISGLGNSRVLEAWFDAQEVTLYNLTLQDGLAQGASARTSTGGNAGGAAGFGGALFVDSKVVLDNVTIRNSSARGGDGGAGGPGSFGGVGGDGGGGNGEDGRNGFGGVNGAGPFGGSGGGGGDGNGGEDGRNGFDGGDGAPGGDVSGGGGGGGGGGGEAGRFGSSGGFGGTGGDGGAGGFGGGGGGGAGGGGGGSSNNRGFPGVGGAGGAFGGFGGTGEPGGPGNASNTGGYSGGGGGGAGLGGGIFVRGRGNQLILLDGVNFSGNSVAGGEAGWNANIGDSAGSNIFSREGEVVYAIDPFTVSRDSFYINTGSDTNPSGSGLIQYAQPLLPTFTPQNIAILQKEGSASSGSFDIDFNNLGSTPFPVNLNYRIGGTATLGEDYTLGEFDPVNKKLTINLLDDSVFEGDETIAVTLLPGNYNRGNGSAIATITLQDNEPTVSVSAGTNPSETGTLGSFDITLTEPAPANFEVFYTISGSATDGTDYKSLSGKVFVPQGLTSISIDVEPQDDFLLDPNEDIVLTLSPSPESRYGVDLTKSTASLLVQDNEVLPIASIVKVTDAAEDNTPGQFKVQLSAPALEGGAVLAYEIAATTTATEGDDFRALTGQVEIAAGGTEAFIDITPFPDGILENPDESVTLTLIEPAADSNNPNAGGKSFTLVGSSQTEATLSIIDNDQIPVVSVSADTTQPRETGPTASTFIFSLATPALSGGTTINYLIGGTATEGDDYRVIARSLTIAEGNTTGLVTISPEDDPFFDPDETVTLTLTAGDNYLLDATRSEATLTIEDNEVLPTATVQAIRNASEDGTIGQFRVSLNAPALPSGAVVSYSLINSTATAGTDYESLSGEVTIAAGETEAIISVTPLEDNEVEGNETIGISLNSGSGYQLNNPPDGRSASILLQDNDQAGATLSASQGITTEFGDQTEFTVTLTSQPTADVVVAIAGLDNTEGTLNTPSLTFTRNNWDVAQTIIVTGLDDTLEDNNQTYNLILTASSEDSNYNNVEVGSFAVTNADNEGFDVSVTPSNGTTNTTEGAATDTYELALLKPATSPVEILIDAGEQLLVSLDGTTYSQTLTLLRTDTSAQTIFVQALDDTVIEGNHNGLIQHSIVTSADPNYSPAKTIDDIAVNITDNDLPTLSIVSTRNASEAGLQVGGFNLVLSNPAPAGGITLNYSVDASSTATAGTDYVALSGTAIIPAGDTTLTIDVTPLQDAMVEPNETVAISLETGDGYRLADDTQGSIAIEDNDTAGVTISETGGRTEITEGDAGDVYSVVLTSAPTAAVEVSILPEAGLETNATTLTFTPDNWQTAQQVLVTAVDDDQVVGDRTATITHTVSSADTNYSSSSITPRPVTVTVLEDDMPGLIITESGGRTELVEGSLTDSYSLRLSSQPTDTVTVSFSSNDSQLGAIAPITFAPSNWDQPQTVAVSVSNDEIATGDRTATITHTLSSSDSIYNALPVDSVAVNITDDDTSGLIIFSDDGIRVEETGNLDSFIVQLKTQPSDAVTVQLSSSPDFETDVSTLTFTPENWDEAQIVFVVATEDREKEDLETINLTFDVSSNDATYNNIATEAVAVEVVDVSDRRLSAEEAAGFASSFALAFTEIETQLKDLLQDLEVPLIGSVADTADELLTFQSAIEQQVTTAEGIRVDDFITFIREGLTDILPEELAVSVSGGYSSGNGLGFRLKVGVKYTFAEKSLDIDLGEGFFELDIDGKAQLNATGFLSLGLGTTTFAAENLRLAKQLAAGSSTFASVRDSQQPSDTAAILLAKLNALRKSVADAAKFPVGSAFIDTDETFFQVIFGGELSSNFEAEGAVGPLTANFTDNKSSASTPTRIGITAKAQFTDADVGVGIKFLDINKNGSLDVNELSTVKSFVGAARDTQLTVDSRFDKNGDGEYGTDDGNQVVLIQTDEFRYDANVLRNNNVSPFLSREPSLFPELSLRWFDVNNNGIREGFEPVGSLLPDGTFDLEYNPAFDTNQNGFYDRGDSAEFDDPKDSFVGIGTLYTYVPDFALQYSLHNDNFNPDNPDDANGFSFLDANNDKIWNYIDFNNNGREDLGEREPGGFSNGQSFSIYKDPFQIDGEGPFYSFDRNGDGRYTEAAEEGRTYTLWAVKAKPGILYADSNGNNLFDAGEAFINARTDGTFDVVSTLDTNRNGRYDSGDGKLAVLRDDGNKLFTNEKSNSIATGTSLGQFIKDQGQVTATFGAQLGLKTQVGLERSPIAGLPNLATEIEAKFSGSVTKSFTETEKSTIKEAALNNIRLDLGAWLGQQVQPFAEQVDKYVAPFRPVLTALGSEVQLLSKLGLTPVFDIDKNGQASVLEIAGSVAQFLSPTEAEKIRNNILKFNKALTVISAVATYSQILAEFKAERDTGIIINFGSVQYPNAQPNAADVTTEEVLNQLNAQRATATAKQKNAINKATSLLNDSFISPLLFSNIPGLIEGKDVPLLGLQLPQFLLDFDVSRDFTVWGPISGLLEGRFIAALDLAFGFDTSGINRLQQKIDRGQFTAADAALPLDGIYISDRQNVDGTGEDKPELTLNASIGVGAGVNVGVASGYFIGGIEGRANLDLIDVGETLNQDDGRIHISEIVQQASNGGLWNVFRLNGVIQAFLAAQIKALGQTVYRNNLATVPLFTFDLGPTGKSTGSAFDGYLAGSEVFFDANFNGLRDAIEPFTYTNADGTYDLDIALALFDINQNGKIDDNEGQIVVVGGIDTSTNSPSTVPLKTSVSASVNTPLTTLAAKLSEQDLAAAETQLQTALGLGSFEVNLTIFDAIAALEQTDSTALQQQGLEVFAARVAIQNFIVQGTQLILAGQSNNLLNEVTVANALTDAIANTLQSNTFDLGTANSLESLITTAIDELLAIDSDLAIDTEELAPVVTQLVEESAEIVTLLADNSLSPSEIANQLVPLAPSLLSDTAAALEAFFTDLFGRLTAKLAQAETTVEVAQEMVKKAFDLPTNLDLDNYNALDAIEQGDDNAVEIFAQQVQVQSLLTQLSQLSMGSDSNQSNEAAAEKAIKTVADYVMAEPTNSLADLSEEETVKTLVSEIAPTLTAEETTKVSQVIAAGKAKTQSIVANTATTNTEKLDQIAQVQFVEQTESAKDLEAVAAGTKDIDVVVETYTGEGLEEQIAEAVEQVNNPGEQPEIENDSPLAEVDTYSVTNSDPIVLNVLDNDTDPNDDPLEITLITTPDGINGSVVINDDRQTLTYTPTAGFSGTDTFFYIIADGKGGISNAQVSIDVTAVPNTPPIATDDAATTTAGTTVTIDVLSNDRDTDGGTLTIDTITQPNSGTATTDATDTITYTPQANFTGNDSFTYTINDGQGGSNTATVEILVKPSVNDGLVLVGNNRNNRLVGSANNDVISGQGGNDQLRGRDGDDRLNGDDGNDLLNGDSGDDTLLGGTGNDRLNGSIGNDQLLGEEGNDRLNGSIGNDQLLGEEGNDRLIGGSGNDSLIGDVGNDTLIGGNNNDTLQGGIGRDRLVGGSGDDILFGGSDSDRLTGGRGSDQFEIAPGSGTDQITDFQKGLDSIRLLEGLTFGALTITQKGRRAFIQFGDETLAQVSGVTSLGAEDFTLE